MRLRGHESLNSDTELVFRQFLNDTYDAKLPMDNNPVGTEMSAASRTSGKLISLEEAKGVIFEGLGISEEQARVEFEISLYSNVDNLADAIALGEGWVFRLVSMSSDRLMAILDGNESLTSDEKEDLLQRNMTSNSGSMLQQFDLTKTESKLLTDFVLAGFPEGYSGGLEKHMNKPEFLRAYKYLMQEKLFSDSYTSSMVKTSSVHDGNNSNRARGIDRNARKGVTYH